MIYLSFTRYEFNQACNYFDQYRIERYYSHNFGEIPGCESMIFFKVYIFLFLSEFLLRNISVLFRFLLLQTYLHLLEL